MFLLLAEYRESRGLLRTTVAPPRVAGHSAIRTALRLAAEWTIVRPRALVGLSAHLPAVVVFLAETVMEVAVHSGAAAVGVALEVSLVAIRPVASRVAVTEAAEAADKSQDKLPQKEDHPILFFSLERMPKLKMIILEFVDVIFHKKGRPSSPSPPRSRWRFSSLS